RPAHHNRHCIIKKRIFQFFLNKHRFNKRISIVNWSSCVFHQMSPLSGIKIRTKIYLGYTISIVIKYIFDNVVVVVLYSDKLYKKINYLILLKHYTTNILIYVFY